MIQHTGLDTGILFAGSKLITIHHTVALEIVASRLDISQVLLTHHVAVVWFELQDMFHNFTTARDMIVDMSDPIQRLVERQE